MPTSLETGSNLENTNMYIAAGKQLLVNEQTLAIVLTADGYSFCTGGQNPLVLSRLFSGSYPENWHSWMPGEQFDWLKNQHPELSTAYNQVHLGIESLQSTLLPSAVYREGTGTDYFELVFGRVDNVQLHRDSLLSAQTELISAFPIGLSTAAVLHFSSIKVFSLEALLAMRWQRQLRTDEPEQTFVHLQGQHMLVWQAKEQKWHMANRYKVTAATDVLYYLSLLGMEKSSEIVLSGESLLLEESQNLLVQYFSSVQWLGHDQLLAFDPQWSNLPPARWQALFACLCAS